MLNVVKLLIHKIYIYISHNKQLGRSFCSLASSKFQNYSTDCLHIISTIWCFNFFLSPLSVTNTSQHSFFKNTGREHVFRWKSCCCAYFGRFGGVWEIKLELIEVRWEIMWFLSRLMKNSNFCKKLCFKTYFS